MSRLAHFVGVGSSGFALQFLDSDPCYKRIAHDLSLAAHAVASLAAIEQERVDARTEQVAATMMALQFLTGFAATLMEEVDAHEAGR